MKIIFRREEAESIYSFEVKEQDEMIGVVLVNVKTRKHHIPQNVMEVWSKSLLKTVKEEGRQQLKQKGNCDIFQLEKSAKEAKEKAKERVKELLLKEAEEVDIVFSEE